MSKRNAQVAVVYEPTEEARRLPRVIKHEGRWIAIGGVVTMRFTPPKLPIEVPEASQEDYRALYDLGYTTLITAKENDKTGQSTAESIKGH